MGGGPKNVTSTTNTEVPDFLKGPLTSSVNAAQRQFNNSGADGNALIGQAQGLTGQTINGDFLSPDSNPFLEGTFNRAADLTRGRLATEFAGNGRDLEASAPARSDELQTLSSNIFGGNYQAERGRQQAAVGQASNLDPLNRFLNQLGVVIPGAGGTTTSQQPVFKTGLF